MDTSLHALGVLHTYCYLQVKMLLFGVAGSSSLLPTIKIIQMAAKMNETGEAPEVAPQLIARLKKVVNGELLAFLAIPLTASLMARGVRRTRALPSMTRRRAHGLTVGTDFLGGLQR